MTAAQVQREPSAGCNRDNRGKGITKDTRETLAQRGLLLGRLVVRWLAADLVGAETAARGNKIFGSDRGARRRRRRSRRRGCWGDARRNRIGLQSRAAEVANRLTGLGLAVTLGTND